MKVAIELVGCDETTTITREITAEQYTFLVALSMEMEEAREYSCYPALKCTALAEGDERL